MQATAEKVSFQDDRLIEMISLARQGLKHIFEYQKAAIEGQ